MLPSVLAVVVAVAVAWWSWRDRLNRPAARFAALARAAGTFALCLLLLDPGVADRRGAGRPLVLLDHSISMHATGGHFAEAAKLAASIGDTAAYGELTPGEPGGRSLLYDALAAAVAGGRPVVVVTDGEIADGGELPTDLIGAVGVRLVRRSAAADIALTEVEAPLRITAGDSLALDVNAVRTAGAPDTASVVVRDSATVLLHGVLKFGTGSRARLHLAGVLPSGLRGERWLTIQRVGAADAEPDDDTRWWRLTIAPTPGVVVIADAPDWDSRAIYRALKDVVEVPIRGYAQLQRGQWRRMDDLKTVPLSEVITAARSADLLAVRGDVSSWRTFGRARLLWPEATAAGDWYVGGAGVSPISGAFAGVEPDSLPPAAGVRPYPGDSLRGWIGATARLSRRGTAIPVIVGGADHGARTMTIGVDGLYRWALRGGVADQAWRTMIANAAAWLLATPEGDSLRARPAEPVTQRGRPLRFRWTGSGKPMPVAVQLRGPRDVIDDTLRFDGAGEAMLHLAVGHYRYSLTGGGAGTVAVEPYSDELVPSPVTLTERVGATPHASPRRSLRELLWLFGLAIAGFGIEWMLRRRLGLR